MKNLLAIALISSLIGVGLPARADYCNSSVSFIQIPGSHCIDLNHLTLLGASAGRMSAATNRYNQAIDLNTSNPAVSVTETIGRGDRAISTTTTYRDNPTLTEQAIRRQILQGAADNLSQKATTHAEVESFVFRRQLRVLNAVSRTLVVPKR